MTAPTLTERARAVIAVYGRSLHDTCPPTMWLRNAKDMIRMAHEPRRHAATRARARRVAAICLDHALLGREVARLLAEEPTP